MKRGVKVGGFTLFRDNRMRGAYGETDFEKKTIRINKKAHKRKSRKKINPNKNGFESLIDTIAHELTHVRHPNMREKNVRKKTAAGIKKMGNKIKKRLYSKLARAKAYVR